MKKWLKGKAGFTVIEVLIAVAIISFGVLAISVNTVSVTQGNRMSGRYTAAVNLAQEKLEEVKAQGSLANGTLTDTRTLSSGTSFNRTWVIGDSPEANLKQVDVTVSWTEYGANRSVTLSTFIYVG